MNFDDRTVLDFLATQARDYGGNVEIGTGYWVLFAVAANDGQGNALAGSLLDGVGFAHSTGASEDDEWRLYYVDDANRAAAVQWLAGRREALEGAVRPADAEHLALVDELLGSPMPHRLAQRLGELHTQGAVSAGMIHDPSIVRALLDRLHTREPLFFAAFQTLLSHHLIDMIVLLQQLIDEDIGLENEIVRASLSRDPFLQSRQDAAVNIRNLLIRFHVINPMDQQRNTGARNPYAEFLEISVDGDEVIALVDGKSIKVPRTSFLNAIRSIRRNLYRGEKFETFNTQVPWMTDDIAYSFRFIKQRLDMRRDLSALDGLFMLERAVAR